MTNQKNMKTTSNNTDSFGVTEQLITTTPKDREGCNISYETEMRCGEELLKELPNGWRIHFSWCQILFSDVQYQIDNKKKIIKVQYNQNLSYWWNAVIDEIKEKIAKLEESN